MLKTLFAASLAAALASAAQAQFVPIQPIPPFQGPDLQGAYRDALRSIAPPSRPSITVEPRVDGYIVNRGGTSSMSCRRIAGGGLECN